MEYVYLVDSALYDASNGWIVGAKLPHILKYVQAYDEMYPGAAKIVIRTDAPFFIQTTGRKVRLA
jgi:hypothetical protein